MRAAERQDVRQLTSTASLHAPVVVQRMLGDVENAVFRVDQLRTVEEMGGISKLHACYELRFTSSRACNHVTCVFADGCLASVRVDQSIQLDGLPLDDVYTVRTMTTATPAAPDSGHVVDGLTASALTITVEGVVECDAGASVTGLKGVIEGILYSQVCLACQQSILSALLGTFFFLWLLPHFVQAIALRIGLLNWC